MDIRLKGNTISYALPYHAGKTGKAQAVRGSKLGSRFTVAGIRQYMQESWNFLIFQSRKSPASFFFAAEHLCGVLVTSNF